MKITAQVRFQFKAKIAQPRFKSKVNKRPVKRVLSFKCKPAQMKASKICNIETCDTIIEVHVAITVL